MMRFLLDTNAVIELLSEPAGAVGRRLRDHLPQEIGLPAIVLHEFYYGAYRSRRRDRNLGVVEELRFEVLDFDREDARHAGEIRAALAERGTPIGAYDLLIAGLARARGLTLVTHNLREFRRVAGLRVEDWSAAG